MNQRILIDQLRRDLLDVRAEVARLSALLCAAAQPAPTRTELDRLHTELDVPKATIATMLDFPLALSRAGLNEPYPACTCAVDTYAHSAQCPQHLKPVLP